MKRLHTIFLSVLFVTASLIIPSIHRAHCADEPSAHDADTCAICQIAHTPIQLSAVCLTPVETVRQAETLVPAVSLVPPFSPRTATQARAPPA